MYFYLPVIRINYIELKAIYFKQSKPQLAKFFSNGIKK